MKTLRPAFDLKCIKINFKNLQESVSRKDFRSLASYQYILASIKSLGIIQPIIVTHITGDKYRILDGHLRFYALRELGYTSTYCIASTDDERYTFDVQINGLSTFQRAGMIQRVVDFGIPLEKIAETLGFSLGKLKAELDVTRGIDKEVIKILKTANISKSVLQALRKVKPIRQIEIAEQMTSFGNFSSIFVKGLIAATPPALLENPKANRVLPEDVTQLGLIESESKNLMARVKDAEEKYSSQIYDLTILCGFINRLLSNPKIENYIERNFKESYHRLKKISKLNRSLTLE